MSIRDIYVCRWDFRHIRNGKVIFEFRNRKNILVDEGEKLFIDTVLRKRASTYFASDNFYTGFYKGTVIESTTLATLPNEPAIANGYTRQAIERSTVGWPTLEKNSEDNWRATSKEITYTASGGDIGPLNGVFFGTSSDNTGSLIGAVATGVERTILSGDQAVFTIKFEMK